MELKLLTASLLALGATGASGFAHATNSGLPAAANQAYAEPFFGQQAVENGSGAVAASLTSSTGQDSASARVAVSPEPTASVGISGSGFSGDAGFPYASAGSVYFFEIIGPMDIPVPIRVQSTIATNFSSADFTLGGLMEAGAVVLDICPAHSPGHVCGASQVVASSVSLDSIFNFDANVGQEVDIGVMLSYNLPGGPPFSATVTVDPLFTIDPAFLAQNPGYSLESSPGIGDSPGVPEPAAWALMLMGFGGLGMALRARRAGSRQTA